MLPLVGPIHRPATALILGVAVSAVAGVVLAQMVDLTAAGAMLARAHVPLVAAAIGSLAVSMAVRTRRWRTILPDGDARPTTARLLPYMIIGYAANALAPLRAGDVVRSIITARRFQLGVPETLGSVGLERVLDGLALATLLLVASAGALVPAWFTQASAIVAAVGLAVLVILFIASMLPRAQLPRRFDIGARVWRGARPSNGRISRSLGWSLLAWLIDGITFWLCGLALGLELGLMIALFVAGGAALGSIVPSGPAAIGTFELGGTAVAVALGLGPPDAFALVALGHAVTVIPIVMAAIFFSANAGFGLVDLYRASRVPDEVRRRAISPGGAR